MSVGNNLTNLIPSGGGDGIGGVNAGTPNTIPKYDAEGDNLEDSNLSQDSNGDIVIANGQRLESSAGIGSGGNGSSVYFNTNNLDLQAGNGVRLILNGNVRSIFQVSLIQLCTNVRIDDGSLRVLNTATGGSYGIDSDASTGSFAVTKKIANLTATRTQQVADAAGTECIDTGIGSEDTIAVRGSVPGSLKALSSESGTGETVGFTAGSGAGVNDDSTFTGNVGATAYNLNDIVKALKNVGILAP